MASVNFRQGKRKLYPTVLCYHGFVNDRTKVASFSEHVEDFIAHIQKMQGHGYVFVLPSQYLAWFNGEWDPPYPIALIQHDDALESLNLVLPWQIENGIPCGIGVIARRLAKRDPEQGYTSWENLSRWVKTGLVEINSHTFNLHTLAIFPDDEDHPEGQHGGEIWAYSGEAAPILEGPCWIDDGDPVYLFDHDSRPYWDFSIIDRLTLGFPIFGTDPYDGVTLLDSTMVFLPKRTGTVNVLRFWLSLSAPSGSGYDCHINIYADGNLVYDGVIVPYVYETRSQWPEREFLTIKLDRGYDIAINRKTSLRIVTRNAGFGAAVICAIPTDSIDRFTATTNCKGLYPKDSLEAPNLSWQYIDYPAGQWWPVIPCMILGFGTGRKATDAEYSAAISADCTAFTNSIDNWLHAKWIEHYIYNNSNVLAYGVPVVGWDAPKFHRATIPFYITAGFSIEAVKFEMGPSEFFNGGDGDPFGKNAPDAFNRSYPAAFDIYISPTRGIATHGTRVAQLSVWDMARGTTCDVDSYAVESGRTYYMYISPVNPGPHVGAERRCRWALPKISIFQAHSQEASPPTKALIYPFGAYMPYWDYYATVPYGLKTINPVLLAVLTNHGFTSGFTIQALRNERVSEFREPAIRSDQWTLGRFLIYGDQPLDESHRHIAAYAGFWLPDTPHRGIEWQVSLEADEAGNSSVRKRAGMFDYVAFDAWFFDGKGKIQPHLTNDGGTYWNPWEEKWEVYPNDRQYLQDRGVTCLLIVNNNAGTGEPSGEIGAHIFNNPDIYIPQMVQLCRDRHWDGLTSNIEEMGPEWKEKANIFYTKAARAFHDAGLLLHCTAPAITGTDYDADWWMGWCDLNHLASVCDGVKIMSYTESGGWSPPRPGAPDWFFNATYEYTRRVVRRPFWSRIYCGCRSFGHFWYPGAEDGADFVGSHECIAEALMYRTDLQLDDTEMHWNYRGMSCWCGTPMTIDRSQKEAVNYHFGGIGLWMLDMSDMIEYIPDTRQIGVEEQMSFLNVTFPTALAFGSSGGPVFRTVVHESQAGFETRHQSYSRPKFKYNVRVDLLKPENVRALFNFFNVVGGRFHSFRFKDWMNHYLDGVLIGVGDGVTVTYQCTQAYAYGGAVIVRPVTKLVHGTATVFVNGVASTGAFIDYNTGIISLPSPPAAGAQVLITSSFDMHVRFDTDSFTPVTQNWGEDAIITDESLPLIEVWDEKLLA